MSVFDILKDTESGVEGIYHRSESKPTPAKATLLVTDGGDTQHGE